MATASWNGALIAQSDDIVMVEGNIYFPAQSVRAEYLRPSTTHTHCNWKGTASYYDVVVEGMVNPAASQGGAGARPYRLLAWRRCAALRLLWEGEDDSLPGLDDHSHKRLGVTCGSNGPRHDGAYRGAMS